uniref:Uncharacterized protein n=1 Tax=Panstrongylus lignarius TaxID=156445 RepID=A0A224XU98_9HEMI
MLWRLFCISFFLFTVFISTSTFLIKSQRKTFSKFLQYALRYILLRLRDFFLIAKSILFATFLIFLTPLSW